MGKARRSSKSSKDNSSKKVTESSDVKTEKVLPTRVLSRGQRKRAKRRDSQIKKIEMVKEHLVTKSAVLESKGALQDITSLKQSILELNDQRALAPVGGVMSSRSRKRVAMAELGQFKAVHAHLSSQKNAFQAIQEHLRNTIAANK